MFIDVEVVALIVAVALGVLALTVKRCMRVQSMLQNRLVHTESHYKSVLDAIEEVVFHVDPDGMLVYLNDAWVRLTGNNLTTSVGHRLLTYIHTEDRELAEKQLLADGSIERVKQPVRLLAADGNVRLVELLANPSDDPDAPGIIGSMKDVTLRNRLESNLRAAYKLESAAHIAAGVAHEINTPIQVITDNLQFLSDASAILLDSVRVRDETDGASMQLSVSERADREFFDVEVPQALDDAFANAHLAAHIIQTMMMSVNTDEQCQRALDLNSMLLDIVTVLQREFDESIDVACEFDDIMPVSCDGAAITSAFINVLRNAMQAIEDDCKGSSGAGASGTIRIRTRQVGDHVTMSIADDGIGIPRDVVSRVFDPFFSARSVGNGVGLGLSIAQGIVDAHEGRMWIESEFGKGTTVSIEIPMLGSLGSGKQLPGSAIFSVLGA